MAGGLANEDAKAMVRVSLASASGDWNFQSRPPISSSVVPAAIASALIPAFAGKGAWAWRCCASGNQLHLRRNRKRLELQPLRRNALRLRGNDHV